MQPITTEQFLAAMKDVRYLTKEQRDWLLRSDWTKLTREELLLRRRVVHREKVRRHRARKAKLGTRRRHPIFKEATSLKVSTDLGTFETERCALRHYMATAKVTQYDIARLFRWLFA